VSLAVLTDGKVVSFLFLPPDDDPDTFVRREGAQAFLEAAGAAKPLSQFLFAELSARVDMATEEGRARFVAQARPLVAQIEAPALAAMLRRRLAELARLDTQEIDRLIPPKGVERRPARAPARSVRRATSHESRLLARILLRPELAAQVPDDVIGLHGAEGPALRAVLAYFRADPKRTLGQASAYFDASEHQPAIEESLAEPLLHQAEGPDLDLEAEISALVETLQLERLARRRGELTRLVESGTASAEQQMEYGKLLASLATSKSGNPPVKEGSKL
jgi:DNA primase